MDKEFPDTSDPPRTQSCAVGRDGPGSRTKTRRGNAQATPSVLMKMDKI